MYEDLNDAKRLSADTTMRYIVGGRAIEKSAASTSEMGRFETEILSQRENVKSLMSLPGKLVDKVHAHKKLNKLILDMDSSVSETYGQQQGSAYNGHFSCNCYHPLFLFNQCGDVESDMLRSIKHWSLTTLKEKLIKIGAKIVKGSRYIRFQMAEVAVSRELFAIILNRIDGLRLEVT